jgi:hypothetical protein
MDILERYIKNLIERELVNGLYGKYLFGEPRGLPTKENPEKDVDEERKLYKALSDWVQDRRISAKFLKQLDKLKDMMDQGLYKDVLKPKLGKVYRGMQLSTTLAEEMFGNNIFDEITTENLVVKIENYVYEPRKMISSWSYKKRTALGFSVYLYNRFYRDIYSNKNLVYVIYKANVANNNFLFDYRQIKPYNYYLSGKYKGKYKEFFPHHVHSSNLMRQESEVISLGPINCEEVCIIPYGLISNVGKHISKKDVADLFRREVR